MYGFGDIDRGKTIQFRQICFLTKLGDHQSISLRVWRFGVSFPVPPVVFRISVVL